MMLEMFQLIEEIRYVAFLESEVSGFYCGLKRVELARGSKEKLIIYFLLFVVFYFSG